MSPQSLSLSHFQMLLMQRPLEQRYWFGRQLCSGVEEICKLLIVGGFVSVYLTTRVFQKQYVLILTRLDAGVVVELVALGTLTLQLSAGRR